MHSLLIKIFQQKNNRFYKRIQINKIYKYRAIKMLLINKKEIKLRPYKILFKARIKIFSLQRKINKFFKKTSNNMTYKKKKLFLMWR
jgi:hypothetical protein